MKNKKLWIFLAVMITLITYIIVSRPGPAQAECTGCGEGGHGTCIEEPGHTHDAEQGHEHEEGTWINHKHAKVEKIMIEEHKQSESTPEDGVVFAVCIFAIAEDGTRVLVDHRASEDLMDCLKNKREAERDYRDPEKRNRMYPGSTVFTMTCDKVNAKVRIKEDGTWEILDILGRHEEAYREKKSYE